mgnify:CR=1 FL=1
MVPIAKRSQVEARQKKRQQMKPNVFRTSLPLILKHQQTYPELGSEPLVSTSAHFCRAQVCGQVAHKFADKSRTSSRTSRAQVAYKCAHNFSHNNRIFEGVSLTPLPSVNVRNWSPAHKLARRFAAAALGICRQNQLRTTEMLLLTLILPTMTLTLG